MRGNSSINPFVRMFSIALATIVAAYTLVCPAKAEIVYRSANIGINDGTYNLDLNGDGITDFTIASLSESCGAYCVVKNLTETSASGNAAIVGPLGRGDEIGPNQVFSDGTEVLSRLRRWRYCDWRGFCIWLWFSQGPWLGRTGYLGLSFQVNGQTHYGWAKLKCPGGSLGGGIGTLLGYAYETVPGRAILAGETSYVWFTPAQLNLGTVTLGNTASSSVSLTNLGPTTLLISNATLAGLYKTDFASENGNQPCTGSVAAGATCTLTFTFTPTIVGKERATYSVYDNTGGSPQRLSLSGTGQ